MAMNIKSTERPRGTKYKVWVEKGKERDFMIVCAKSPEDAISQIKDSCRGTGWKIAGAEEERREGNKEV